MSEETEGVVGAEGGVPSGVVEIDSDLRPLIPAYVSHRKRDFVAIRRAAAADDYETIRILGHGMKNSGANYGLDLVTELGAELERAGDRSDSQKALAAVERLEHFLDTVEIRYVDVELWS